MLETEELKNQIQQLDRCNNQEIDSICKSCHDFLRKGSIDVTHDGQLIRSLLSFTIQAIKLELTENDIKQRLTAMNCNPYFMEQYTKFYQTCQPNLSTALIKRSLMCSSYDHYDHIRWRFEIKLASKYCREQFQPNILLSFYTKNSQNQMKRILINCTVADIFYIYKKIREIIDSNNSFYCTKLLRNIKL
nr:COMM domain-containing protein 2-like [Dermatophagoides farinae]